jgi:hypothetical protein
MGAYKIKHERLKSDNIEIEISVPGTSFWKFYYFLERAFRYYESFLDPR